MGQGSYDADSAFEAMQDLHALRQLWKEQRQKSADENTFTRSNYPNEPMYMLHQNYLIQVKHMSSEDRQELAKRRYIVARIAKIGETVICPGCGSGIVKRSYQHVFCSDKVKGRSTCKDFINNWFNTSIVYKDYLQKNVYDKKFEEELKSNTSSGSLELTMIKQWLLDDKISKTELEKLID